MLTPIPVKCMIYMIKQAQKRKLKMATHRLMNMDHETESQTEAGTLEPQLPKKRKFTIPVF